MALFNIQNPAANQILVYSEIESKFVNVSLSDIMPNKFVTTGQNMGNGFKVYNDTVAGIMRFKTLLAGNGIQITNQGSDLEISFDGNATTLNGLESSSYLQVARNLSDIDVNVARENLSVYSKDEADSLFMGVNDSSIPSVDNKYSIGSNGRRYADIYATTFHGIATESITASTLKRNGANEGDYITWSTEAGTWVPIARPDVNVRDIADIDIAAAKNGSILIFNETRRLWEAVDSSYINSGGDAGTLVEAENVGSGLSVYATRFGSVFQFRTITGGDNVSLKYNFNNEEIVVSADVPETTDSLPEGTVNKYYTQSRVKSLILTTNLIELNDLPKDSRPRANQGIVWNGTSWDYRNIAVDITSTDNLPEGSINRYYTDNRVYNAISSFISSSNQGISLSQLKDVTVSNTGNTFLKFDGTKWSNVSVTLSSLSDMSINGIGDNQTIVYSQGQGKFVASSLPRTLAELSDSDSSKHFNTTTFDQFFNAKSADDIQETDTRKFLNASNLGNVLNGVSVNSLTDVTIDGIRDGNILVWSAESNSLIPATSDDLDISVSLSMFDINNVNTTSAVIEDGQWLIWSADDEKFIASTAYESLGSLSDVALTSTTENDALVYDGNKFVNTPSIPYSKVNDYAENQFIIFDTDTNKFVNKSLTDLESLGIGINTLDDVSVDTSTIAQDSTLIWDSVQQMFVAGTISTTVSMSNITDVNLTGLSAGMTLVYDGSNFVVMDIPDTTLTDPTDNDILVYDSGTFVNRGLFDVLGIEDDIKTDGDVLIYSESLGLSQYRALRVSDIGDLYIDDTTLEDANNYALQWDIANNRFNLVESSGKNSLLDYDQIVIDGVISEGDTLVWNDTLNNGSGGFGNVNLLTDQRYINPVLENASFEGSLVIQNAGIVSGSISGTLMRTEKYYKNSPVEASFNPLTSSHFVYSFVADTTVELVAPDSEDVYYMTLILSDGNNFAITWPENMVWLGATEPTLTERDIIRVMTYDMGVTWIAEYKGTAPIPTSDETPVDDGTTTP